MATIKQKQAFTKLVGNGGNVTQAMLDAGYTPATANTPQKLTESKGWKELTDSLLSDKVLLKKHTEQLNSSRLEKLYFDIDDDEEMIEEVCKKLGVELLFIKINKEKNGKTVNVKAPNFLYRDWALDKAYKVKGRYMNEDNGGNKTLIINIVPETAQRYELTIPPSTENNSTGQA